mmetsp:Transcript_48884/g.81224  ORF Transcript_48884/g.81224 Transcript_48884/m.81224 type:complete len:307 (+) Transcript_48884:28-948(+)|eukprot:CAMPEP_0119312284 /NCGR_PEP_ID=MMETSP1333-20130426/25769_1 /TAXON_ID=418940 /ORGANISM="Scyphosphaera apsteinii, Strain RCC1455" /LENGTH=306 /DNA_ID=CAMNT_0007316885 /DNA_START=28 /DNA_END=948 /DNA_ORIENTATION=+
MEDEFAAFQAEVGKLAGEADKPQVAGPKAPKVISAGPTGRREQSESLPMGTPLVGGARVPVSQWPNPEQIVSSIKSDFPRTTVPELPSSAEGALTAPKSGEKATSESKTEAAEPHYTAGTSNNSMARASQQQEKRVQPAPQGKGKHPVAVKEKVSVTERMCAGVKWVDKTLHDWPEDDFRIFVGDLGNETNDDVLAHAFARYPSFQKARVVRNKNTQKSMGFGFVSFKDPWDMTKALREMHGKYIGNRPVKVRKSTWKERSVCEQNNPNDWHYALAVNDKKTGAVLATSIKQKRPHVHKKKKGMPW